MVLECGSQTNVYVPDVTVMSKLSVPVLPTSVDTSTSVTAQVEVVDVGLVVDLERVAARRERLDRLAPRGARD
jgi:hypothetical protein